MSPVRTAVAVAIAAAGLVGCGGAPDDGSATTEPAAITAGATSPVVEAGEATALLAERDDLRVIDVRTPEEFADGHLEDAELFDIQDAGFEERLTELDRDGPYVVYCRTGTRSAEAAQLMERLGFTEVYDAGGYADLAAAGAPTA